MSEATNGGGRDWLDIAGLPNRQADLESRAGDAAEPAAWPMLAPEALLGLAGEVVVAATENSEADKAAVLATLLALTGAVAGRGPFVRVGDDHHHARLFMAISGQSARSRKGTSEAPIRRIWQVAEQVLGPLNWKPGPMSSGEGLIYAIRDGDGKENGDPGIADKRLFVTENEFASLLRAMQRRGNTISTVLRCAWDGKTLEPLTKSSPIKASEPHVVIVGHITQTELVELLGKVEIFNGFANRFLWWLARRSGLVPMAPGMRELDVQRLGREYAARLGKARHFGEIEFNDGARRLYDELYPDLSFDHPGPHGVVTARAEAQAIRLALIYALLEASPVITAAHLTAALAVIDYCDQSARLLFGSGRPDPTQSRILRALEAGPKSTAELHGALGGHVHAQALNSALEHLQGRGRINRDEVETGGRPRITWRLRSGFDSANKAKKAN